MTPNSVRDFGNANAGKAKLLAIVAVPPHRRVQCANPGCGHGVYAAIHIVEDAGQLLVMGSTCFAKRYGSSSALGVPQYSGGGGNGRLLTEEERSVLVRNTAALLSSFKDEHEKAMAEASARLRASQAQMAQRMAIRLPPAPVRPPAPSHPWPWQHQQSNSVALIRSPQGQIWIRVQHRNGSQRLVPWPVIEGWQSSLPAVCGSPDAEIEALVVTNIVVALQALQEIGFSAPVVSRWPDLLKLVSLAPSNPQMSPPGASLNLLPTLREKRYV